MTYAIGFATRPLGGVVFGGLGDRYGRKRALVASLMLMGFATMGVGLIPGYALIGVALLNAYGSTLPVSLYAAAMTAPALMPRPVSRNERDGAGRLTAVAQRRAENARPRIRRRRLSAAPTWA
jgi:MFS family permease